MSDSHVIARKFRPQSFEKVVGQEAIRRTLENSIRSGRIHHAYLFAGARGVGKTTTARILAKCLNCVNGPTTEPCGVCASCKEITASRSIDVMEIDAASNTGVDNVRDVIINTVQISPARDRYKTFIIDEVHMLSNAAFNALLKTLEEPPPRVAFIMATTELHKVPETILSRCQVFEFRTITLKKIFEQLRFIATTEGIEISDAALLAIARAGEGSMRDAESALDQVISYAGKVVKDEDVSLALGLVDTETLNQTMRAIGEQNAQSLLRLMDEVVARGYDLRNFCRELMTHVRAILVVKVSGFDTELVQMPANEGETLKQLADLFSEQDLIRFFSLLTKTEQDLRATSQPRFQLEIGLMKLLQSRRLHLLEDALEQLSEVVAQLGGTGLGSISSSSRGPNSPGSSSGSPAASRGSSSASRPPSTPTSTQTPTPSASPASTPSSGRFTPAAASASDSFPRAVNEAPQKPSRIVTPPPAARKAVSSAPPWEEEPPPHYDDAYETTYAAPPNTPSGSSQNLIGRLKEQLMDKKKMMLISALNKADAVTVDGDHLRVSFSTDNAGFKNQVDTRDNRKLIEEVCREITGRKITLAVTVGTPSETGSPESENAKPKEIDSAKYLAENHPKLRAITEKFQGQVIEIIKPEPGK